MTDNLPWAHALIQSAEQPIPQYGSDEWAQLPDTSRAKVAACVIAAEAWRTYWEPAEIALRARLEIDGARASELEDEEPELWTPDVVAAVHATADQPSFAELCRRRGETEAETRANTHRRRLELPVPLQESA